MGSHESLQRPDALDRFRGRQKRTAPALNDVTPVLPDILAPGLLVVFVGTAKGDASVRRGHYYAGRGNKFWDLLGAAGLVEDERMSCERDGEVLRFGVLLAIVLLAAKVSGNWTHEMSLVPLAATSSAVDVDPITLSAAKLTGTTITPAYAATVVMVAAGSNVVCKSVVALLLGTRGFAIAVLGSAVAAALVAAAAWFAFS